MKKISLANAPKIETGFKIPEDYFDILNESVQLKIANKDSRVLFIHRSKKIGYSIAATITLGLISIPIINYYTNQNKINAKELEEYITYNSSISEDEIINLLEKEDIEKIKIYPTLKETEIEDALQNNTTQDQYIID